MSQNQGRNDAAHKTLYIFDELTRLRTSTEETAKLVQQRIESWESVTADSAEMKSCADYRAFGILCREAVKGPGSVNQSMKWLQGLAAIVIDPHRCPDTAKEFSEYEYEVGRDGTLYSERQTIMHQLPLRRPQRRHRSRLLLNLYSRAKSRQIRSGMRWTFCPSFLSEPGCSGFARSTAAAARRGNVSESER